MMDMMDAIFEFHNAMGIPAQPLPNLYPEGDSLRESLITEEFIELHEATKDQDLVEIADALGDIVYVAFGTAINYGINLNLVLEEIHRSNMTKVDTKTGKVILRHDGKVMKPPSFSPADIGRVLANQPDLY